MAFDLQIAALTVFCEASGETSEARRGVAYVMMNRLRSHRFGRTLASVCLHRYQFSEWNDDKGDNANLLRGAEANDSDPVMRDCVEGVQSAMLSGDDPTMGALFYHDDSIAGPPADWGTVEKTVQIGRLIFYREAQG